MSLNSCLVFSPCYTQTAFFLCIASNPASARLLYSGCFKSNMPRWTSEIGLLALVVAVRWRRWCECGGAAWGAVWRGGAARFIHAMAGWRSAPQDAAHTSEGLGRVRQTRFTGSAIALVCHGETSRRVTTKPPCSRSDTRNASSTGAHRVG